MWRIGVLCKMRRVRAPFSQAYGNHKAKLQRSSLVDASQVLVTAFFSSWQQSMGSEVSGSVALLLKQSLQVRIQHALCLGDKKMATDLLKYLGSMENPVRFEDCVPLLEYCCKAPEPEFALELWSFMDEKKLSIKQSGYLYILHALTKGGYLDEALYLLKMLGEKSCLKTGLSMYNIFLNGCYKFHSLVHANSCLELMENKFTGKSEITYTELMKLAVHGHSISALKQVWEEYKKFYSPSILSFQKLIRSLCSMRAASEANDALQRMVLVVLKGSDSLQRSQNNWVYSSKVHIPVPSKSLNALTKDSWLQSHNETRLANLAAPHIFKADVLSASLSSENGESVKSSDWYILNHSQELKTDLAGGCCKMEALSEVDDFKLIGSIPAFSMLRQSFNDVIHLAALTANYDLAEQLFAQMHNLGLEPSLNTYNVFLDAVVLERGVIHGMKVVKAMENKNLKPNNFTYATLAVGYSHSQQLDLAEAMLDQMVDNQPHYRHPFHSLLAACCIGDEPERAVRVLARMRHFGIKPIIRTYELMFSLFGNVNYPYEQGDQLSQGTVSKRIAAIEMDMVRNGIEHSQTSLKNLLRAFGAEGMIKEMLSYLQVAEDCFNGRDAPRLGASVYNVVLHVLVEAMENDMAKCIFERMKSFGIRPDVATYNIMVDCCCLNGELDVAHGLMATMLQDGYKHHAYNYTSLMKIFLRNHEFEAVLDLFNEMKEGRIHSDVTCYNTILREISVEARLDIIELLVEHMHRQKIQPDPETCLHVFYSYHDNGFLDTAIEALQVLSVRMMSEDETVQREMKSAFEELVLDEGPNVEETIVEIFKDSKEYLSAALFNMRFCALQGVSNSWLPDESPWARRLRLQYN